MQTLALVQSPCVEGFKSSRGDSQVCKHPSRERAELSLKSTLLLSQLLPLTQPGGLHFLQMEIKASSYLGKQFLAQTCRMRTMKMTESAMGSEAMKGQTKRCRAGVRAV